MKKTAAWLAVHALEQLGVKHTFGIPGVQNTEFYDELNKSEKVTPVLVTHGGAAAFVADAVSRVSGTVGTLAIVPAAGLTHAASGRRNRSAATGRPMVVDVNIDYSKRTAFTQGVVKTNFKRFPLRQRLRMASRALVRKVTG